jgi:hypothetical protein
MMNQKTAAGKPATGDAKAGRTTVRDGNGQKGTLVNSCPCGAMYTGSTHECLPGRAASA